MTDDLILLNADWFNLWTGESHAFIWMVHFLAKSIRNTIPPQNWICSMQKNELLTWWKISLTKKVYAFPLVVVSFLYFILAALRFRVHVKVWIIKIELFCGSFGFWLVYLTNEEDECRIQSLFAVYRMNVSLCEQAAQHWLPLFDSCKWQWNQMINTIYTLKL